MNHMTLKRMYDMGKATGFTMLFIAAITIFSELDVGFKDALKVLTGHHWITKSVLSILFFIILYYYFSRSNETKGNPFEMSKMVIAYAVFSGVAIFTFYLWHLLSTG